MGLVEITAARLERAPAPQVEMDSQRKTAVVNSKPVVLTRKEFDLLALLHQNAGELVTREDLLLHVWGYGEQIRTRTLDVHIRRLRKKLGEVSGVHIETIFNVGYRLQPFRAPQSAIRLLM